MLKALGEMGSRLHCVFVAAASSRLLQMDDWRELSRPRDVSKIFSTPEYWEWREFRSNPHAEYVALAMPRFGGRARYVTPDDVDGFPFDENLADHEDRVWLNAAYALGHVVIRAFSQNGWPLRIDGLEGGGTLDLCLEADKHRIYEPGWTGTEVPIRDRREAELIAAGLVPLVGRVNLQREISSRTKTYHQVQAESRIF